MSFDWGNVRSMVCNIFEFARRAFGGATKSRNEPDMTRVNTIHLLIKELEKLSPNILALDLCSTIADAPIEDERFNFANDRDEIALVARAAQDLPASAADLRKMMTDLLSQQNFYGQLCEFAVYDWLKKNHALFHIQVAQSGAEVLNPNGTDLDGMFDTRDVYFDIKGFGFESYVREKFRAKLSEIVKKGRILIEGSRDNSVKDMEGAFRQLKKLASDLQESGTAKIPELNWTLRTPTSNPAFEANTVVRCGENAKMRTNAVFR
ncbi:hypothetical protein [Bradyrhizobium barranii]